MDKSCQSSADTTTTSSCSSTTTATTTSAATNNNRDQYLKHLNKLSHKISKPIIKKPPFDPNNNHTQNLDNNNNNNTNNNQPQSQSQPQVQQQQQNLQQQQQQQQPPVYNINKNDFRDVVQKLTGSPAHERFSAPPPIHAPKPPSSRLQRIRPPPLANVSNRPPPLLNGAVPPPQPPPPGTSINPNIPLPPNFGHIGRPFAPLSPLPPFPTVHAAAESPVSAYMRILQNSISTADSNPKQFSGFLPLGPLVSPRWNNFTPPQPHHHQQQQQLPPPHQQQGIPPLSPTSAMIQSQFSMPSSPLPFGCLNSPRSQYPLLSPGLLFSPTSGQLGFPQLPLSPTVPVPSPRWRGL